MTGVRERLVVIGADAGGMTAASQARRRRPAERLDIVAVDRGRHASYSACGIPYWIGGAVGSADDLVTRTVDEFRKQDIDVRLRTEAVDLDLDRGEVTVRDLENGALYTLGFDQLVLGMGAVPTHPDIDGIDAPNVFGVQTLDDGEAVRAAIATDGVQRAVIVGGGYIGLEMAEAFVERGLEVTVVEAAPQPMSTLDADMGAMVANRTSATIAPMCVHVDIGCGAASTTVTSSRARRTPPPSPARCTRRQRPPAARRRSRSRPGRPRRRPASAPRTRCRPRRSPSMSGWVGTAPPTRGPGRSRGAWAPFSRSRTLTSPRSRSRSTASVSQPNVDVLLAELVPQLQIGSR